MSEEIPPDFTGAGSDEKIAQARRLWSRKRRKDHLIAVAGLSFHTSPTFMDYLHGDVDKAERGVACAYEYARESALLRSAAAELSRSLSETGAPPRSRTRALMSLLQKYPDDWISSDLRAVSFLLCESFPAKDWNELGPGQRALMARLQVGKDTSVRAPDLWSLHSTGILTGFQGKAREAEPVIRDVSPGTKEDPVELVPPLLVEPGSPCIHVILNLDLSKSERTLVDDFRHWLRSSEIGRLHDSSQKLRIGTTGKSLDHLKALAAWRLYRELGNDWSLANDFASTHRKGGRPFHAARAQGTLAAEEADLFSEEADARKSQAAAWRYLEHAMPREFAAPHDGILSDLMELEELGSQE